jgi:hypothetical protein
MMRYRNSTIALSFSLSLGISASAWGEISNGVQFTCQPVTQAQLDCNYRLLDPKPVTGVSAEIDGAALPAPQMVSYPITDDSTAMLLVIDTSAPEPASFLANANGHIKSLLASSGAHHRIGLTTLGSAPSAAVPLGSPAQKTLDSAATLARSDKTRYRHDNLLHIINGIGDFKATRKVMLYFADGQANDAPPPTEDLLNALQAGNIQFNVIGYSAADGGTANLEWLKPLAEGTGGRFTEAIAPDFAFAENFHSGIYQSIDNGGHLIVDLSPVLSNPEGKLPEQVTVSFALAEQTIDVAIPVIFAPGQEITSTLATEQQPDIGAPSEGIESINSPQGSLRSWMWYTVPLASLIAIVLAFIYYRRLQTHGDEESLTVANEICAFLIPHHDQTTRFIILKSPWRIGRDKTNELSLADNSVSRLHAEIVRNRDNSFAIRDADSLNGVFVNEKKISTAVLQEGDEVDVGDVRFTFTLQNLRPSAVQKSGTLKPKKAVADAAGA